MVYWKALQTGWRQQGRYWWNLWFLFAGDFLKTYIKICIWSALTAGYGEKAKTDMAAYSMIGTIVVMLTDTRIAQELSERFRSGRIAMDLIQPVSLPWYFFCSQLGENMFRFLTEGMGLAVVFRLAWRVKFPGPGELVCFGISVFLGMVLLFFIQYTMGLLVFWMKDGTYTRMMTDAMFTLFSGVDIPLWFYPWSLAKVCKYLPFRYVMFEPAAVFLGQYSGQQCVRILADQALWIGVMMAVEWILWRRIGKRIEIQGG